MNKILTLGACFALLSAPDTSSALSIPEIVSKAKPAVLKITAYDSDWKPLRFGTGFFISDDGRLVTNLHVIEDAKAITAETVSGASYFCEGVLIQPQDLDLVVLKFKAKGVEKLVFGDSSKVTEGQRVIVIGNPEGLEGTISEGIVAAIRDKPRLIQITAPISPGSSGSPGMDEEGSVLGVATLSSKEGQNLNFAIPGDEVTRALASIPKEAQVTSLTQIHDANPDDVRGAPDIKSIEDLEKQHNESEALRMVGQFLRNHPADASAWSLKARILGSLNLGAEAVEAQKTVIRLDADNAGAWADMVFYLSLMAGGTQKPNGIESEIRSPAEHAIALGDDREMTWDLLVWSCKTMGDSTAAAKYEATRDEKISHGELTLRTMALSNLISGDYARIDLDNYVSAHSLTLALESKDLVIRGGPTEVKLGVDTTYPNSPWLVAGKATLGIDVFPRKSKNAHWYISEDTKTKVLKPALGNPDLPPKPDALKAYLARWPRLTKQEEIATDDLIREVIAQDPRSFASFSEWKPSTPGAAVIFCSVHHVNLPVNFPGFMGKPLGLFITGLLAQAPVDLYRTQRIVDRDLQQSALLQISFKMLCRATWSRGEQVAICD